MSGSARLNLPFLSAGQAQKEISHNEALQILDLVAAGAVEEPPRNDPPASPEIGACFIVGSTPTGVWAGRSQSLAGFSSGGWRYVAPTEGLTVYVKATGSWSNYRAGEWELGTVRGASLVLGDLQVVGPRLAAIGGPTGGDVVDSEARAVLSQILGALREHGLIET